jgi:hypothetical protein
MLGSSSSTGTFRSWLRAGLDPRLNDRLTFSLARDQLFVGVGLEKVLTLTRLGKLEFEDPTITVRVRVDGFRR